jgi:hypothetical protein
MLEVSLGSEPQAGLQGSPILLGKHQAVGEGALFL